LKKRKHDDTAVDPSVEEIINNWTHWSQKEGLCSIVNCYNKPTTKCKKCKNYYCKEHFKSHLDLVPDRELENSGMEKNGLDEYT
jgi:hypothetical protein